MTTFVSCLNCGNRYAQIEITFTSPARSGPYDRSPSRMQVEILLEDW